MATYGVSALSDALAQLTAREPARDEQGQLIPEESYYGNVTAPLAGRPAIPLTREILARVVYDPDGTVTGKAGSYYDPQTAYPVAMPDASPEGRTAVIEMNDRNQADSWGVPYEQYIANKTYYEQQARQMGMAGQDKIFGVGGMFDKMYGGSSVLGNAARAAATIVGAGAALGGGAAGLAGGAEGAAGGVGGGELAGEGALSIGDAAGVNAPGSGFLDTGLVGGASGDASPSLTDLVGGGTSGEGGVGSGFSGPGSGEVNAGLGLGSESGLPNLPNIPTSGLTGGGSSGGGAGSSGLSGPGSGAANTDLGLTDPSGGAVSAGDAAKTALGKILDGTATADDYLKVFGQAAPGLIGAFTADQQTGLLKDLADKYAAYGEPSRARYEASYAPGFTPPEVQPAIDAATEAGLRKLSTQGNPYGNPGGLMELTKYVTGNVALPQLNTYRNQNAATGGYNAFNTAAPTAATNAVNSGPGMWANLASAFGSVTNPTVSLQDLLKQINIGSGSGSAPPP